MISEAILIPKIYARLQEIASNFLKFFGGPQTTRQRSRLQRSVRGFAPLLAPPFQKFLDPPLIIITNVTLYNNKYRRRMRVKISASEAFE